MNNNIMEVEEHLSFKDDSNIKHGLHGHVKIYRENTKTGECSLWNEGDNIIPISGYQWILLKMFGLYLDSSHAVPYDDIGQDTTLIIPDLNNSGAYQLGIDPADYTPMETDFPESHFVQGFMVGNGGSGEDTISSKNTNYSFIKLRNPIPFQQIAAGETISDNGVGYLGVLRTSQLVNSYYIKKFSERPHVYHSWWKNGQNWDYVDPVTQNDLGPNAVNGVGKTNRIESYIECVLSLSESDCLSYFQHEGSTQTAAINELGLVAFDALSGKRSIISTLYNRKIKTLINICFDNNRTEDDVNQLISLANEITTVTSAEDVESYGQTNINNFISVVESLTSVDPSEIDFDAIKNALSDATNIEVTAYYDQSGTYIYETDKFMHYLEDPAFDGMSSDEAQRIKLITYYTFNSIPLQEDWRLKIYYRIYAN